MGTWTCRRVARAAREGIELPAQWAKNLGRPCVRFVVEGRSVPRGRQQVCRAQSGGCAVGQSNGCIVDQRLQISSWLFRCMMCDYVVRSLFLSFSLPLSLHVCLYVYLYISTATSKLLWIHGHRPTHGYSDLCCAITWYDFFPPLLFLYRFSVPLYLCTSIVYLLSMDLSFSLSLFPSPGLTPKAPPVPCR